MNNVFRPLLILFCVSAASLVTLADSVESPVPAGLEAPANQKLALTLTARGVQIYECHPVQGDPTKFEWVFKAPEADLFDAEGHKVGRHYAGPTWELTDGGKVVGHVKAKADAPDRKGVAWLLVEASENSGGGVLGRVRTIQRVGTVGGNIPSEAANQTKAGQERRVEYRATYRFYVSEP